MVVGDCVRAFPWLKKKKKGKKKKKNITQDSVSVASRWLWLIREHVDGDNIGKSQTWEIISGTNLCLLPHGTVWKQTDKNLPKFLNKWYCQRNGKPSLKTVYDCLLNLKTLYWNNPRVFDEPPTRSRHHSFISPKRTHFFSYMLASAMGENRWKNTS